MSPTIPLLYRLFFLYIEPISALVGAYYAAFAHKEYLALTDPSSISLLSTAPSLAVEIILRQLANLYLLFAINEALVLRATNDITVWKAVLIGLLIADLGHLWSVGGKGWDVYWNVASWNAIDAGNVGFVYAGAGMRIAFLWGVGFGGPRKTKGRKTK